MPAEIAVISPSVSGMIEKAAFTTSRETERVNAITKLPSVGTSFWPSRTFAVTVVGSVSS